MKRDSRNIDRRKLVLYLLDEISQAGRLEVEAWLAYSQENHDEYKVLKKTWLETGKLELFPREIDVDNVWDQFSKRLDDRIIEEPTARNPQPATRNAQRATRLLRFFYAAAAVTFLAWVSITMIRFIQEGSFKSANIIASQENVLQDTLPDGSAILLNENSTLKFAKKFNSDERKVELTGEAFFEVDPDSTKPFIVDTDMGQIRVLGTSFQVKGFPESDLEVFVEEGRVELSGVNHDGEGTFLILNPGERGIIKYSGGELVLGGNLQPDDLFWVNRKLIFEETKLSLVFELLRIHYSSKIEIQNENILDCLLSATFNDETVDQILAVIAISFDLKVEKVEGKFIIKGKGCENE